MLGKLKKNYFLLISTFLILYFFFNLLDGERGLFSYFKKKAVFTQLIQISSEEDFLINGDVYFMTCDAGQCLPPEAVEFSFEVEGTQQSSSYSIWRLFFIAFLSGFAALLTPSTKTSISCLVL